MVSYWWLELAMMVVGVWDVWFLSLGLGEG